MCYVVPSRHTNMVGQKYGYRYIGESIMVYKLNLSDQIQIKIKLNHHQVNIIIKANNNQMQIKLQSSQH